MDAGVMREESNYYYEDGNLGETVGPVSIEELKGLRFANKIDETTQVTWEGAESWLPYSEIIDARSPTLQSVNTPEESSPANVQQKAITQSSSHNFQGITKMQGTILIILFLVGLGAPFWVILKPTPKWEYETAEVLAQAGSITSADFSYKTVPEISSKLNTMGSLGWELVGVFLEQETAHPNFGANKEVVTGLRPNIRPQKLVLIFKRPKK